MQLSYMQLTSIRKLVKLAQLVEQWTGNREAGGSSPPANHLIFGCLRNSFRFPLSSQMYAKLKRFCNFCLQN